MSGAVALTAQSEWRPVRAVVSSDATTAFALSSSDVSKPVSRRSATGEASSFQQLYVKARVSKSSVSFSLIVTDLCGVWVVSYDGATHLNQLRESFNPELEIGEAELLDTISDAVSNDGSLTAVATRSLSRGAGSSVSPQNGVVFRCEKRPVECDNNRVSAVGSKKTSGGRKSSGSVPSSVVSVDCNTILALSFDKDLGGGGGSGNGSVAGGPVFMENDFQLPSYTFSWTFECQPLAVEAALQASNPDAALARYATLFLRESFILPLTAVTDELARQHSILLRVIAERDREFRAEMERRVRSAASGAVNLGANELPEFDAVEFVETALASDEWHSSLSHPHAPFGTSGIVARLHGAYNMAHYGKRSQQEALGNEFEFDYDPSAEDRGGVSDGLFGGKHAQTGKSVGDMPEPGLDHDNGYDSPSLLAEPAAPDHMTEPNTQGYEPDTQVQGEAAEPDTQSYFGSSQHERANSRKRDRQPVSSDRFGGQEAGLPSTPPLKVQRLDDGKDMSAGQEKEKRPPISRDKSSELRRREERRAQNQQKLAAKKAKAKQTHGRKKFS